MGSPQIQHQESFLDRVTPSQHRQSLPTQPVHMGSPVMPNSTSPELNRWAGESTALYNLNQGLAVSVSL